MESARKKVNRLKSIEPHVTGTKSFARVKDEEVRSSFSVLFIVLFKYSKKVHVKVLFNVDEKEQGCKSVTRRHVLYNPNPKKWKHRKCCSCSSCGMLFINVVNE